MRRVQLFRILLLLPLAISTALLLPGTLRADQIKLLGDWTYFLSRIDTEDRDTQETIENRTDRLRQIYRLDLNKELFPTLTVDGGAQVEKTRQDNEFDDVETNTRDTVVMPYVDAELRTSLYSLVAGYRERNARRSGNTIDGTEKDYLTSYNLRGEWRPVDLPRMELSYLHSERSDKPLTNDRESDIYQFNSRYEYRDYEFLYNFLRSEESNRMEETESQTNTHNGRVRYRRSYLDGRVTLNARLRAEYTDQTFSGDGDRDFAVSPAGNSFFFIDSDTLPNNNDPAIDYRYEDFADNLDLNSDDIFDIGLDFGEAVRVDMLQLSLSAELDPNSNIDNTANWAVYVSDDQDTWQARAITEIEYLDDERLLQIRFSPGAEHEYVMVVYSNIAPLAINQSGEVLVTSIQAFETRDIDDGSTLRTHAHNVQVGVGWQATDKTKFNYDLNIQERDSNMFDDQRLRLSNGLNVFHLFNETFTGSGRFSVTDTWEEWQHDSSNYNYSAKLNARYLETLNQSMIYSGSLVQDEQGDSTANSVILRTNAELYQGWDASFDQGYSWQSPADDVDSESVFIRLQNSLSPHRRFSLLADYSIRWRRDEGENYQRTDSGRLRALWVPRDTISLTGEVQLRVSEGDEEVFWEYGANWLPLRDGSLQCSLSYSEEEELNGDRTRTFSPSLSWDITRYATLSLRYSQGKEESEETIEDFQTAQINLRINYN